MRRAPSCAARVVPRTNGVSGNMNALNLVREKNAAELISAAAKGTVGAEILLRCRGGPGDR